ncbi:RDD family protein [Demequina sp. TTPB684]|uniref:RDD family protein n=1 Tax=unclassified Demequina TaxID=2620311 RepID=UPI001CF441C4|nr:MULTISPECIES: RDD family protein [unclassified Demequina]MCB2413594.1 RDD family protein [Demequina sp. TTPB684]UPU88553.1 RDD family protein [Demequina sp. TMPB413]
MSINEEIVLGEGVAIDSGAASVVMRVGSGAIDAIVMYLGFIVLLNVTGPLASAVNEAIGTALSIALIFVWFGVVPALVETLTRGLSLGRLALGLRIVRDDGGPVSARYAFGRALVGLFEVYLSFGLIAIITSFMSARGKRVGDILVGTYAMRTRGGRKAMPPIVMPFGMTEWAQKADVRRLPDGLALTARLFLGRAHQMSHDARYRFGKEISEQLATYVAPPPPEGTHPETFIAAVLATRRDREYASGITAQRLNAAEFERLSALPYGIPDSNN